MVVYYELVFIDNIALNFLVLFFSSKFYALKTKVFRLLAVSIGAAAYATCAQIDSLRLLNSLPIKLIAALLICFAAFGFKCLKRYLKATIIFLAVSFLVAGVLYASLSQGNIEISSKGVIYSGKFVRYMLYGIFFMLLSYKFYIYMHKSTPKKHIELDELTLYFREIKTKVFALKDTGNMLVDSALGIPIILVSKDIADEIYDGADKNVEVFEICISTIGQEKSLKAIRLDRIEFKGKSGIYECVMGVLEEDMKSEYKCIFNPNHFI
jgi:stage II sporulation protein GA (sporulation sigma-E factor processing peptidase)